MELIPEGVSSWHVGYGQKCFFHMAKWEKKAVNTLSLPAIVKFSSVVTLKKGEDL